VTDHADVRRLRDIEEIKQLKARYLRFMDHKQWDAWATVFTTDCVMEVPEVDTLYRGREAIVTRVSAVLAGTRTCHHAHMPEIELTGETSAVGIWAMFDYVEWPRENGTRVGFQGYGHYHEAYAKDAAGWRIAGTRLERLRVDSLGSIPDLWP
jgi:hypothetical protein